jgi:hypothetical protein
MSGAPPLFPLYGLVVAGLYLNQYGDQVTGWISEESKRSSETCMKLTSAECTVENS